MSDLISRQAVIDMVKGWNLNQHIMNEEDALDDVNALPSADQCMIATATSNTMVSDTVKIPIMDGTTACLPSVQTEQKKRRWIFLEPNGFKCPECNRYLYIACGDVKMNLCPNCGADMRGE